MDPGRTNMKNACKTFQKTSAQTLESMRMLWLKHKCE